MKFLSDRMTSASGSIGGTVFSHNSGGMYTRARSPVTNPNSPQQVTQRTKFAQEAERWATLTEEQRAAWNAYAVSQVHTNKLGLTIKWSGFNEFVAANTMLRTVMTAQVADPPLVFDKPALVVNSITVDDEQVLTTSNFNIPSLANSKLFVACSRPVSVGVNFFKGPFCGSDATVINVAAGGTTFTGVTTFPAAEDQVIFVRVVLVLANGRYSVPVIRRVVVTAAP